jgi:hypothetical protein
VGVLLADVRAHLREPSQHLDQVLLLELSSLGGDELDEHLPRVSALADDEVPQVAGLRAWSYGSSRSSRARACTALRIALPRTRPASSGR